MDKILTLAVPAYNAAWCLAKCLDSFLDERVLDRLDILVVNDGSSDNSLAIASGYAARFPASIRVHDKTNGGHGSVINVAAQMATGRYFKIIDADDWVVTANLPALLDALDQTDADAVIADFQTVDMTSGRRQIFRTKGVPTGAKLTLDQLVAGGRDALQCATFHGLFYNSAFYRSTGVRMSENIFFEDHEYATLPFAKVRTVLPLRLFFYEYMIGNVQQSVSDQSQVRRIGQIEQVIFAIVAGYEANPDMSAAARQFFIRKLSDLLLSYYVVALVKNPDRTAGRLAAKQIRQQLAVRNPELIRLNNHKYWLAMTMNHLHLTNRTLELLKRSFLYKSLYNAVRKK